MRIRKNFVGSVYVAGNPFFAGDEVPDGSVDASFGEVTVAPVIPASVVPDSFDDEPEPEAVEGEEVSEAVAPPGARATKSEWQNFLTSQNIEFNEKDTVAELSARWEG